MKKVNMTFSVCVIFGLIHLFTVFLYYRHLVEDSKTNLVEHLQIISGLAYNVYAHGEDPLVRRALATTGLRYSIAFDASGRELKTFGNPLKVGQRMDAAARDALMGNASAWLLATETNTSGEADPSLMMVVIPVTGEWRSELGAHVLAGAFDYEPTRNALRASVSLFFVATGAFITALALGLLFMFNRVRRVEYEAREAAEEGVWVKNQLLSTVSHELRTPLNGIMGMLSLLKDTKLDSEQSELVVIAGGCSDSLLALVENILEHIKFEVGRTKIQASDFDLKSLLGGLADHWTPIAAAKGPTLTWSVDSEVQTALRGDHQKLARILTNLLDNAVKFSKEGEIRLFAEPAGQDGDIVFIEFSVSDTGIGIDQERLPRVFEPMTQVDRSATRHFGGLGMGLCLTRELVNAMGGRIRARSVFGEGSVFKVLLPFKPAGKAIIAQDALDGEGSGEVNALD